MNKNEGENYKIKYKQMSLTVFHMNDIIILKKGKTNPSNF